MKFQIIIITLSNGLVDCRKILYLFSDASFFYWTGQENNMDNVYDMYKLVLVLYMCESVHRNPYEAMILWG